MSLGTDRIETVTVDSYGTLVDPSAAEKRLADRVDDPEPVSNLWRMQSIAYTMIANHIDAYQPFYEMNRDALQYALDAHGVDLSAEERDEILEVYHELDVFDDVRDGIERLRDGGYPVYVVSNGNPEMLSSMVEHADIGDLVEETISAHEIETFKPDAGIYEHAADRTDTPIENMVHVAGPAFDIQGAIHAGMQGAWLNRYDDPWGRFDGDPDVEIDSFHDLAEELDV
jgi:2-haloacid dehalogenase